MLKKIFNSIRNSANASATSPTNWVLLVRSEGSDVTEFVDIRQNGCAVWQARGAPYTLGERDLKEFPNAEDAEGFLNHTVAENQARGLELVHRGCSIPGNLDFGMLEQVVYDGAREAYQQICAEHEAEFISGFSLFTDFDGMTIAAAAMAETSFSDIDEEEDYYRTNPSEWPYRTDAGLLLAYRIIVVAACEHSAIPFEAEIKGYFEQFCDACIRALERLDRDGFFTSVDRREDFLLLFGVSDGGPTKAAVERLNPESVYRRYAHCFDE